MKRYFLFAVMLFFSGCALFEPKYFERPKVLPNIKTKKEKAVDKIKWKSEEYKEEYKGYITSKNYDPVLKMWRYKFETTDGKELEFFYNLKLGYDNDLIKISLKTVRNRPFLDSVDLIFENVRKQEFVKEYDSKEKLYKKRKLKKRTLNRLNRKLGVPKEEKIDIY